MIKHLLVPVVVLGTAGTAGVIRVMRGMLIDELRKQYVVTARTKGLSERRLLFRYPVAAGGWPSTRSSAPWAGCCRGSSRAAPSPRWC